MNFIFSGHETFPLRYTWISKTASALENNDRILADIDQAIVELGLGKNMVRALRFWLEVGGIIESQGNGHCLTELGKLLFGPSGLDPYLEDIRSLWVLHWMLATNRKKALFAWHHLLYRWHEGEFTPSAALEAFEKSASILTTRASEVTLHQHFSIFIHTYLPQKNQQGQIVEESLECPLAELNLISVSRFRAGPSGQEPVYAFNYDPKPEITPGLFAFALLDYWKNSNELALDFRAICYDPCSPGQVFKLREQEVRSLLESVTPYGIRFEESAAFQRAIKTEAVDPLTAVKGAYQEDFCNV